MLNLQVVIRASCLVGLLYKELLIRWSLVRPNAVHHFLPTPGGEAGSIPTGDNRLKSLESYLARDFFASRLRSLFRVCPATSDLPAPGEALFKPAGQGGEGETEDEVDGGDKDKDFGREGHGPVVDLGSDVGQLGDTDDSSDRNSPDHGSP